MLLSHGRGGQSLAVLLAGAVSQYTLALGTVPLKGQVLNRLAAFWFEATAKVAPNHLLRVPDPNVLEARECDERPRRKGRA